MQPIERVCPGCGAEAGRRCIGKRGYERKAFHQARGRRRRDYPVYAEPDLPTESPIEKILAGAILGWLDHSGANANVSTQTRFGPFRADILIEDGGRKLIVECDGAAFHGSPEQVARDKRRDRYCAARGICVMRFSGAEIHRDPRGCAAEVGMWITLK